VCGPVQDRLRSLVADKLSDAQTQIAELITLTAELQRTATALVAAEQDCCQFLRFAITVDVRGVALEVTAPDDARPIVESLFGAAS